MSPVSGSTLARKMVVSCPHREQFTHRGAPRSVKTATGTSWPYWLRSIPRYSAAVTRRAVCLVISSTSQDDVRASPLSAAGEGKPPSPGPDLPGAGPSGRPCQPPLEDFDYLVPPDEHRRPIQKPN